jgi:hypothetical protein
MGSILRQNNLPQKEKKNVHLSVACGCLNYIYNATPGPNHSKKKRMLRQTYNQIIREVGPQLPQVSDHNMQLFKDTVTASGVVVQDIVDNGGIESHVLLNLAGFCLNELPLKDKHWKKFNSLFDLWEDAYEYKDVRSGDRIFNRIESEVQILVAQRGGVIL